MTRRRTPHITLVLIGAAALGGCGPREVPATARDHYASLDDCAADWGRPEACDRVQSSGYPAGAFIFRGPPYAVDNRAAARQQAYDEAARAGRSGLVDPSRQGRAIGSAIEPTARGGFGARSRSFSTFGS
ncbi:MAG TPA: hypothetical protein VFN64_12115 [Burkholderiaceae bacterium]|nr:hypothetical protein [Burkholderiaceae bacterium]